jgi:hypothetical protein
MGDRQTVSKGKRVAFVAKIHVGGQVRGPGQKKIIPGIFENIDHLIVKSVFCWPEISSRKMSDLP